MKRLSYLMLVGALIQSAVTLSVLNIFVLVLVSLILSFVNTIFVLSLTVIILRRMARMMEEQEMGSGKASIFRIITVLIYLIATMALSYVIQFAINKIPTILILIKNTND